DILRKELGFQGLTFTDALNMKGITKFYPSGEADLMAFLAGNDILLFSQNVPLAIQKIEWAVKTNKIKQDELERRVKKILSAKYDAGLATRRDVRVANATEEVNKMVDEINKRTAKASVTLVKDD